MVRSRAFCVLTFCLFAANVLFAQEKPSDIQVQKEKEQNLRTLTGQILSEIPNLRLPDNRAYVYAKAGAVLWESDEKTAKGLFQNAVDEILSSQQDLEPTKRNQQFQQEMRFGSQIRSQVLGTIASKDAEFALLSLYKTSTPLIAEALAFRPGQGTKINSQTNMYPNIAQNETNLEQTFVRLAASQNPARSAKLLKESLLKDLSNETFNLLSKLYEIDPAAADELTGPIVGMLVKNKFMTGNQVDYRAVNIANSFLNNFIQKRPPNAKFVASDPALLKNLAEKLIAFHLEPGQSDRSYYVASAVPFAEKLVPGSVAKLKQLRTASNIRNYGDENFEAIDTLLNSNPTSEQLIAEAGKYPLASRGRILQAAASKLSTEGNAERAKQILEENFADQDLESALSGINWNQFSQLQNQGKYAEAENMIDSLPENSRLNALINLADQAFSRDRDENRSYAISLLAKARSLMPTRTQNSNEMSQVMQVIRAYADIDQETAFLSIDSLMPQINEITDASIIVYGFQGNSNIRNGEISIAQGDSFGMNIDQAIFLRLSEKDWNRTLASINTFSRIETRITLKLQLAERTSQNLLSANRVRSRGKSANVQIEME